MRIISGKYKGRRLEGFNISGTRPTMDRVKESIFAMIRRNVKGSKVLDLFAGSGSLGIEALSNGAVYAVFVDNSNHPIKILKENLIKLNVEEEYRIIKSDYKEALKKLNSENENFDLIFLDPPYNMTELNGVLKSIHEYKLLSKDGYIICEFEFDVLKSEEFEKVKEKKYGSKKITIFKNLS